MGTGETGPLQKLLNEQTEKTGELQSALQDVQETGKELAQQRARADNLQAALERAQAAAVQASALHQPAVAGHAVLSDLHTVLSAVSIRQRSPWFKQLLRSSLRERDITMRTCEAASS